MTAIEVPCPTCSATGESTHEDRHAGTNKDICTTCGGRRTIPARPGESRETSWPWAVPEAAQARMAEEARQDRPAPEILRHVRSGGLYEVLHRGAAIHSDVPLSDDAPVTVCRRIPDGQIVARFGPTPRGSFEVLHHSRLQTDVLLHDGAEVVVYRGVNGGPVWTRPTSEMDDGRFEPADALGAPFSTPARQEEGRTLRALLDRAKVASPTPDATSGGEAVGRDDQTAQFIAESEALEREEEAVTAAASAYRSAFLAYDSPHLTELRHRVATRAALKAARDLSASQEKGEADA